MAPPSVSTVVCAAPTHLVQTVVRQRGSICRMSFASHPPLADGLHVPLLPIFQAALADPMRGGVGRHLCGLSVAARRDANPPGAGCRWRSARRMWYKSSEPLYLRASSAGNSDRLGWAVCWVSSSPSQPWDSHHGVSWVRLHHDRTRPPTFWHVAQRARVEKRAPAPMSLYCSRATRALGPSSGPICQKSLSLTAAGETTDGGMLARWVP